jgi:Resolvase, N terminal domain
MGFNSLEAQGEAGEAYVESQKSEGWLLVPDRYDDGGYSGGTLERPALKRLLADIEKGRVDAVVVYEIDRLSRSLIDFAKLVEVSGRSQARPTRPDFRPPVHKRFLTHSNLPASVRPQGMQCILKSS